MAKRPTKRPSRAKPTPGAKARAPSGPKTAKTSAKRAAPKTATKARKKPATKTAPKAATIGKKRPTQTQAAKRSRSVRPEAVATTEPASKPALILVEDLYYDVVDETPAQEPTPASATPFAELLMQAGFVRDVKGDAAVAETHDTLDAGPTDPSEVIDDTETFDIPAADATTEVTAFIDEADEHHASAIEEDSASLADFIEAETVDHATPSEPIALDLPPFDLIPPAEAAQTAAIEPPPFDIGPYSEATPAPTVQPSAQHEPAQIISTPTKPDYLERARQAAQNYSPPAPERKLFGFKLNEIFRLAAGVVIGLGTPTLFAIWSSKPNNEVSLSPANAAASEPAARTPQLADTYRTALARLEADRSRDGVELLRHAAEGDFALAQYRLAKLYESGEHLPRNLSLAREWTERAARNGNCRAMHDTGVYYARGEGGELDLGAAFLWFREAAQFGVADSQYNLGLLYQQGRGVAANREEALFWFLLAARQSDGDALDRALDLATGLSTAEVDRVQARAAAFSPQTADAAANDDVCAVSQS